MRMHLILRLFLIAALALVSGHWAVSRSLADGAVALELCADGSITTVTLDRNGTPVTQHHDCPDCVLAGLGVEAAPPAIAAPVPRVLHLVLSAVALDVPPGSSPHPVARGPPPGILV